MKLNKETRSQLKTELKDFEQRTPMTVKERRKLRKWVEEGNSVYSNPHDLYDDKGRLMDFLSACHVEKDYREAAMSAGSKDSIYGDPKDAEKLVRHLRQELFHLWMFIGKEDLYSDAAEYIQDHTGEAPSFELLF